jgi:hypothetical protein
MTVSTTAGVTSSGQWSILGSIGFSASAGSAANANSGAAGQLSFSAVFDVKQANVLSASDAVTIATQLVVTSLLVAEHPLAEVLSVKGIWQGTFDLAGVYKAEEALDGVVQITIRLDGRFDDEVTLEGVVETSEGLSGRA